MSDRRTDTARKFLVVVDQTPECLLALRFAARRAQNTNGTVQMLFIIEPDEFAAWMSVGAMMRAENRRNAEERLLSLAEEVKALTGITPEFVIREGIKRDQVLAQIREDKDIRVLVLGAGTSGEGPGPLVAELAGRLSGQMPIPVTVVPGSIKPEDIDQIS